MDHLATRWAESYKADARISQTLVEMYSVVADLAQPSYQSLSIATDPGQRPAMSAVAAPSATSVIDVRLDRLTRRFDDVVAVNDISLENRRAKRGSVNPRCGAHHN